MASKDIRALLRQPTTIHGIAALVGTAGFALAYFAAHTSIAGSATVFGTVFGLVSMVMSDNTGRLGSSGTIVTDTASIEKLVTDTATGVFEHHLNEMIPTIVADIRTVLMAKLAQPGVPVVQVPSGQGAGPDGNAPALVVPTSSVAPIDLAMAHHRFNVPST